MYRFIIDRPGTAPGTELQVHGLGIVKNGQEFLVDDEAAETFRVMNSTLEGSTDEEGNTHVVQVKGATLLQTFKDDPDVTVEVVKAESSRPRKQPETEGAATDEPVQDNEGSES
jgi:hypothetical protein